MKKLLQYLSSTICLLMLSACYLTSPTLTTAQKVSDLDADVEQGVQLTAGGVMSNDPHTIQWFVTASQSLNALTANGAPTLAQIDAEIANKIPTQYQGVVNNAVSVAVQKYQTWFTQNQASLDATNTGQYVLGVISAARDGINAAIANLPPAVLASAPGIVVSPTGTITVAPTSTVLPVAPVGTPPAPLLPDGSVTVTILPAPAASTSTTN